MGIRLISTDIHFIRILGTSQFSHYIFWKVDQYRSRSSCSCNIKCFFQDTSEVFPVSDRNTIFRNASGDSDNIYFLERIISDQMSGYLPRKAYQWYTVVIGSCKTCHKIRCPRSACNQTHSCFSGWSCISICLMYQCYFLSRKNYLRIILLIKFITDIDRTGSRIPENCIYLFFSQRFY